MSRRQPHTTVEISPDTMVCRCCGKPAYRLYRPDADGHRYIDQCVVSNTLLGYDAAVTRAQWLLSAQAARQAVKDVAA